MYTRAAHPVRIFSPRSTLVIVAAALGAATGCRHTPAAAPAPASAAAPAPAAPNTLTEAETAAGWRLLFDGTSTAGWRGYKKDVFPATGWAVDGGVLKLTPPAEKSQRPGDIVTVEQFERFELALDWRLAEAGNSGVMYHVLEDETQPWRTGPEMQILDNARHKDGKKPETSAGACYALYPPIKDATRPIGEWNQARLVVAAEGVEHWLNGEKVVEYKKGSDEWIERVAGSKFKTFPAFGKPTRGHIALQDHGDVVEFRNVKIRPLP
jgi:hypothetical protein